MTINAFKYDQNTWNTKKNIKKKTFKSSRYPSHHEPEKRTKILAATGSILGTVGALAYLTKKQNKSLFKIKDVLDHHYDVKDITIMSLSSVAGGVAFGSFADKKDDNVPKVKEGIFQAMNMTIPAICTSAFLQMTESSKLKNNKFAKFSAMASGVVAGMFAASAVANFINDPNDNEKDREITLQDAVANLDDVIGALVLAKIPVAEKLHLHRVIPGIYSWCGYRAGQSN